MRFFKGIVATMVMLHSSTHQVWASGEEQSLEEFKSYYKNKSPFNKEYKYRDRCAEICYKTKSCRNNPNSQGSYCKVANYPSTCFGLYHTRHPEHSYEKDGEKDGKSSKHHHKEKYCYEPNDPRCPVCTLFFLSFTCLSRKLSQSYVENTTTKPKPLEQLFPVSPQFAYSIKQTRSISNWKVIWS